LIDATHPKMASSGAIPRDHLRRERVVVQTSINGHVLLTFFGGDFVGAENFLTVQASQGIELASDPS
jgi:hypothetical protein